MFWEKVILANIFESRKKVKRNLSNARGFVQSIEVEIRGGLGNQLFQAAGGVYYANVLASKLFLNDCYIRFHPSSKGNSWLRRFDIEELLGTNIRTQFIGFFECVKESIGFNKEIEELHELEVIAGRDIPRNLKLNSFFQHARYVNVESLRYSVLDQFDISKILPFSNFGYVQNEAGAVHMRLGDYLKTGISEPYSYYFEAIRMLLSKVSKPIHVYSDSLEVAKKILTTEFPREKFIYPELEFTANPLSLLVLLSKYPYFVGSMSTYSWWAAALNIAQKAELIFPSRCRDYYTILNAKNQVFI